MKIEEYVQNEIEPAIRRNRSRSSLAMNTHNVLSIIGIVLAAASAAVLAVGASVGINLGILIAAVSCSACAAAVLVTDRVFDYERRGIEAKRSADDLEKEMHLYEMQAGIYTEQNESLFVTRCEEIKAR